MFDDAAFMRLVQERGLKLKAVAAGLGMSTTSLYRKRKTGNFSREEIQRCCIYFGCKEMGWIFFA